MKKIPYLELIHQLLPDEDQFLAFQKAYQQIVPKSIKLISFKASKADLDPFFTSEGRNLSSPALTYGGKFYDEVCYVEKNENKSLGSYFLHQAGFFYVQEVAAGLSAQVLPLEKGDLVLDLCAAPGGKTIQLADQLLSL